MKLNKTMIVVLIVTSILNAAINTKSLYPVLKLNLAMSSVALFDGYSTIIDNGREINNMKMPVAQETNPISRAIIGQYPTWRSMVLGGTIEFVCVSSLEYAMKQSKNKIIHNIWFLPSVFIIGAHAICGTHNMIQHSRNVNFLKSRPHTGMSFNF
jgi:hypothetical protein